MKKIFNFLAIIIFFTPLASQAQITLQTVEESETRPSTQPKIFYGGGVGIGFGDVDYYELWPLLGVNLNAKMGVGIQFLYRHRTDKRFQENLTTDDYGATLFARYKFVNPLFLQFEYEYLNYEYRTSFLNTNTKRDNFSSFMGGGGISRASGQNTSLYATVLYNFSYDQTNSPYDNPWILRFGISVGF